MQVVPVEEEPASGVVAGVVTEQPGASSGVDQTLAMLDGPAHGGGRGSLEFLGRWNDKRDDRAMPVKLGRVSRAKLDAVTMVRVAFCKLVDELVQTNATSGTLAISCWTETRQDVDRDTGQEVSYEVVVWRFSWSASPDDTSYQRHGAPDEAARLRAEAKKGKEPLKIRFADFEGAVDDLGNRWQIAVYRVTLPSRGLDPGKWVGRPPPPAPEDLYTGPRDDGLLSTEEISGDYRCCCFPFVCQSMSVVPLGADVIETWNTCCLFLPPLIGPMAGGEVRTRDPGANTFGGMTFSAGGRAGCFWKWPGSQQRAFHKVETRDLAGKWRGCDCSPFVPFWLFSLIFCTRKKALNEDQYAESGHCRCLALPLPCPVDSTTRTRIYVNGHPTNGFALGYDSDEWVRSGYGSWYRYCDTTYSLGSGSDVHWYRDSGRAGGSGGWSFFARQVG